MSPELQLLIVTALFLGLLIAGMAVPFAITIPALLYLLLQGGPAALNSVGLVAWGSMNSFVLTTVPLFMLMAEILSASGLSTRTPGAPTNRCATASGTTARPRRATLRSSPTEVIQLTRTPSGSAARPSASTTSRRESIETSGVCSTPSNTLRCQLFILACHSPVLLGPALAR